MEKRLNKNKLNLITLLLLVCISQTVFADTVPLTDTVSKTVIISANVVPSVVPENNPIPGGITSGGSSIDMPTIVNFSGLTTNSSAKIYVLKDGQIAVSTNVAADSSFKAAISGLNTNSYNFSLYAEDPITNQKSSFVSIPIYIIKGTTVNVSNIYLPFKEKEKEEVKQPSGSGCPKLIGDLNCDNHVNLIDFTLLSTWYKKTNTPPVKYDLNKDGKITLVDFSIMMYNWTD